MLVTRNTPCAKACVTCLAFKSIPGLYLSQAHSAEDVGRIEADVPRSP